MTERSWPVTVCTRVTRDGVTVGVSQRSGWLVTMETAALRQTMQLCSGCVHVSRELMFCCMGVGTAGTLWVQGCSSQTLSGILNQGLHFLKIIGRALMLFFCNFKAIITKQRHGHNVKISKLLVELGTYQAYTKRHPMS